MSVRLWNIHGSFVLRVVFNTLGLKQNQCIYILGPVDIVETTILLPSHSIQLTATRSLKQKWHGFDQILFIWTLSMLSVMKFREMTITRQILESCTRISNPGTQRLRPLLLLMTYFTEKNHNIWDRSEDRGRLLLAKIVGCYAPCTINLYGYIYYRNDFSVTFVRVWLGNKDIVIFMKFSLQNDVGVKLGVITF